MRYCTAPIAILTKALAAPAGCYKLPAIVSAWQGRYALRKVGGKYNILLIGEGIDQQDIYKGDRISIQLVPGQEAIGYVVDAVLVVSVGEVLVRAIEG